jgi:hypothetical protein
VRIIIEVPIVQSALKTEAGVTRGPAISSSEIAEQLRALADNLDAVVFDRGEFGFSNDGGIVYWNPETRAPR